ncbi:hypothetical protein DL768_003488 [Monosporascus sp. mg162]|nr:hypothetical protein DL768_003488 [Monosporascus sp. mg162]
MDGVSTDKPKEPGDDPQREQQEQKPRHQSQSQSQSRDQYALPPFPAMTAIRAMSGLSGTGVLSSVSPQSARPCHKLPFVQPSSYLRPKTRSRTVPVTPTPMSPIDEEQMQGLKGLRDFLRVRTSYDVLPLSFRLIVLDNDLLIKKSLNILVQNGIVSAPLWDSHNSRFAGLLTSTDYINLIQYYCQFPEQVDKVEEFRLSSLRGRDSAPENPGANLHARGKIEGRSQQLMIEVLTADIEKAIGVLPLETVSVHPSRPLYEACSRMLKSRARRIPLVDTDDETGRETIVSVITQYRILKFIAVNTEQHTMLLKKTVREINLGTYKNLITAMMSDTVLDVINQMVVHNISAVPIIDKNNVVLNVFEAVDVIHCIKGGVYEDLTYTVGEALCKRADDFPGIYTCQEDDRLESIFTTVRQSRVHRLVVIDDNWHLKGMISLSDILKPQPALNDRRSMASSGFLDSLDSPGDNSSVIWTSSSGGFDLLSEADDVEDRASTRGIFGMPSDERVVDALYDHYYTGTDSEDIARTIRSPTLPAHIKFNVHDIAAAFKRFLAGLLGGVLGSLAVLDALVPIHSQLDRGSEHSRTKETRLRARLIALTIGSVSSQYRRELICAVFGLLSLVGGAAETTRREDEVGHPLPTSDLMGYNALSTVFGPLLIGDMLDSYNMRVADPVAGLVLLPGAAPKSKSRQKSKLGHGKLKTTEDEGKASSLTIDKIGVVNVIGLLKARSFSEDSARPPPEQKRQLRAQSPASSSNVLNRDLAHSLSPTVEESPLPRTPAAASVRRGKESPLITHKSRSAEGIGKYHGSRPDSPAPSLGERYHTLLIQVHPESSGNTQISETTPTLVLLEVTADNVPPPPPHKHDIRSLLRMPNVRRPKSDDNLRTRAKVDAAPVQEKKNTEAGKSARWVPPLKSFLDRWNTSHAHVSEANADHASEHFDERDYSAEPTAEVAELEEGNIYLDTVEHLPEQGSPPADGQLIGPSRRSYSVLSPKRESAADKARPQSPAKSFVRTAKERRLFHRAHRHEEDSEAEGSKKHHHRRDWRRLLTKRSAPNLTPTRISQGRGNVFEKSSQVTLYTIEVAPAHDQELLTAKPSDMAEIQDYAQSSTFRPAPGSVKSMKAVFGNAAQGSRPVLDVASTGSRRSLKPYSILPLRRASGPASSKGKGNSVESSKVKRELVSTGSDSDLPYTAIRRTGRGKVTRLRNASLQLSVLSPSMMRDESRISGGRELQVPQSREGLGTHHVESARDLDRGDDYYNQQSDDDTPQSLSYPQSRSLLRAQVHSLMQQLEACNEEVAELQRQLKTLEAFDENSLYGQLQQARLEAHAWRKRAEAAERRVLVPERFTAQCRGPKEAASRKRTN